MTSLTMVAGKVVQQYPFQHILDKKYLQSKALAYNNLSVSADTIAQSKEYAKLSLGIKEEINKRDLEFTSFHENVRRLDTSNDPALDLYFNTNFNTRLNNFVNLIPDSLNFESFDILDQIDNIFEKYLNHFHYTCAQHMIHNRGELGINDAQVAALRGVPRIPADFTPQRLEALEKAFQGFLSVSERFFLYYPVFYNPVTGLNVIEHVLRPAATEMVDCIVTNQKVIKRRAIPTVYGTYISRSVWEMDIGRISSVWVSDGHRATAGLGDTLVKRSDTVTIFSKENKTKFQHVYIEHAKEHYHLNKENGRYYNFVVSDFPYFVIGMGFTNKATLDADPKIQWNEAFGCYMKGSFRIFNKTANVLDYFEPFKAMPYEQVVKGNNNSEENTLFLGLELEVEKARSATSDLHTIAFDCIKALNKHCITNEDGSLRDGFEIISVPATLAYHYTLWEDFLRGPLRKQLVSFNSTRCGIHIHLSKNAFTDLGLGRFMTFINSPVNRDFIVNIAQRDSERYAPLNETKISRAKDRTIFRDKDGDATEKFSAVNLSKPNTVEVRIFKGTLHYPSVMKNLEFCHALHNYCHHVMSNKDMNFKLFVAWLTNKASGNRKAYPNLFNYLLGTGWIADRTPVGVMDAADVSEEMIEAGVESFKESEIMSSRAISKENQVKFRMINASKAKSLNRYRSQQQQSQ